MADLATLAIKVENGDVVKATTSLNSLEVAGTKTETATRNLTRRMALLEIQAREMDAEFGKAASEVGKMGAATERGARSMALMEIEARKMDAEITKAATANRYLTREMALAELEARKMNAAMSGVQGIATKLGTSLGVPQAAIAGLTKAFAALSAITAVGLIGRKTIEETEAAQAAMAQLEAAVASTGGAAGRSVAQLDALSVSLQKQTTFSDEAIKGAEAMLLAFDKIKGDQFDRATAAVTDLATRMGGDLSGAAIKVGKALQDPEHGLVQLRKSGVSFSDAQIAVIKNLYDTGHAAEAQNLILDELAKKFGGAAAAARDTLGGALAGLKNAWGDLFEVSRGASQGTVAAINAITRALESSGVSMNTILKDATVDWETMRASIEKVRAILALQINGNFLENARNIIRRIDFDLSAKIADLNKPAKTAPVGGGGSGDDDETSKRTEKFRQLLAVQDLEIAKQNALNAVVGASSATIALLNNEYDARAARAKNAIDHTTAETAALNKRTDALKAAKDAAVLEAQAVANRKEVADVQRGDSEAVRNARQALELAGLSDEAAAQRRVDMQAENDLAAARVRFAQMTKDLDKERADVGAAILQREQDIYNSTARRVEVVRQLGHETAAVTAEMDKQKKAEEDAQREQERRARDIRRATVSNIEGILTDITSGKNPLIALAEGFKRAMIRAISEALAEKFLASRFAAMLGIGVEGAAKKQDQAAMQMVEASKRQLRAAEIMAGIHPSEPGDTVPGDGMPDDAASAKTPAWVTSLKKIGEYAAVAYGGYQAGQATAQLLYSQSHGAAGNYARGALGGAVSGAVTGAAIGSIIPGIGTVAGGAIGAVTGFIGGIVGIGKASKEAAKQTAELRKELSVTMDGLRAEVGKDALAANLAQVEAQREQIRKQIEDAYSGGGRNSDTVRERNKQLAELNKLEDERIRQLKEEAATMQTRQIEDYQSRQLHAQAQVARNQGNTAEADRLDKEAADRDFYLKQQRERQDLVTSFGSEIDAREKEILAAYDAAAAAERNAYATNKASDALNDFATAIRNAPTGFKTDDLNRYIQENAVVTSQTPQWQVPTNPFVPPTTPLTPSIPQLSRTNSTTSSTASPVSVSFGDVTVTVAKTNASADDIAKSVVKKLDEYAASLGGLNSDRIAALKRYPSA